jgi:hypothetical protein
LLESGCFIVLDSCRRGGICGGSIRRGLTAAATGLRLPPLQVFTQRVTQPVLAGDSAVVRAFIWLVGHGVLCSNGFEKFDPIMSHPGEAIMTDTYALAALPQQTRPDGEVRPIKALQALGDAMGNRIGPQIGPVKQQAAAAPR